MRYLSTLLLIIFNSGLYGQSSNADYLKGNIALSQGQFNDAIEYFSEALRNDKNNEDLLILRSQAYYSLKDYKKTIEDCEKILAINKDIEKDVDLTAMWNIGVANNSLGNYNVALKYLNKVKERRPDNLLLYENVGISYLGLNQLDSALKEFEEMVRIDPVSSKGFYGIGKVHYLYGDYKKAIKAFDEAIHINPNYAMAYQNRGSAKMELGDMDGCCVDWQKCYLLGLIQIEPYFQEYCK